MSTLAYNVRVPELWSGIECGSYAARVHSVQSWLIKNSLWTLPEASIVTCLRESRLLSLIWKSRRRIHYTQTNSELMHFRTWTSSYNLMIRLDLIDLIIDILPFWFLEGYMLQYTIIVGKVELWYLTIMGRTWPLNEFVSRALTFCWGTITITN